MKITTVSCQVPSVHKSGSRGFLAPSPHTTHHAGPQWAPVVTRFLTYDVKLNAACSRYCQTIMALPEMKEWVAAAKVEPDDIEELDMDF